MINGLPVAVVRRVGRAWFVGGLMLSGRVAFAPAAMFGGVRAMVGIGSVVTGLSAILGSAIGAVPRIVGRVPTGVACRRGVVRRRSASFVGTVWAS